MKKLIGPKYFFSGFLIAFALCSLSGFIISKHAKYKHFVRFFSYISTSLDYFPTANELLATAKHKVPQDKILVLIGGNSLFRGDGQNVDELWSNRLQQILGDKYRVLNYGYNGAGFASFGGVAYRILSEHYPKIIFTSPCAFDGFSEIDGGTRYDYLFWDAYYKGLFHPNKVEQEKINALRKIQLRTPKVEIHLMSYFDSLFYFRSLWNWVSYHLVFTVWNQNARPKTFAARHQFFDEPVDNKALAEMVKKTRFKDELKSAIEKRYHDSVDLPSHELLAKTHDHIYNLYDSVYTPRYRAKALCFVPTYNPAILNGLSSEDRSGYEVMIEKSKSIMESLGYHTVRAHNLEPRDYIDIMHYVASGGYKIAEQIAPSIIQIAKENHYLDEVQNKTSSP